MDDADLLRQYVNEGSEPAFTDLVGRHLSLVYFSALRQVRGARHRAKEIAQIVFTNLARKSPKLTRHTALAAWLHTSTRFAAAKFLRSEHRRTHYEQEASAMHPIAQESQPSADWDRLQPVIDEALHSLNETDRQAILLRFFGGHSFPDIGRTLRLSENGARIRVERALEKLRELLRRRGVTSTSAALALALADQAGIAAPAGLAAGIAATALAGAATTASFGLLNVLSSAKFITALSALTSLIAAAVATHQFNLAAETKRALEVAGHERDALARRLRILKQASPTPTPVIIEPAAPAPASDSAEQAATATIRSIVGLIEGMQHWFDEHPDQWIPELAYLTQWDWISVTLAHLGATNDEDQRRLRADLRNTAREKFAPVMRSALTRFSTTEPRQALNDITQLKPYFNPPINDTLLTKWRVLTPEERAVLPNGEKLVLTEDQGKRVDSYDSLFRLGPMLRITYGVTVNVQVLSQEGSEAEALLLYRTLNAGKAPAKAEDLMPFFRDPAAAKKLPVEPGRAGRSMIFSPFQRILGVALLSCTLLTLTGCIRSSIANEIVRAPNLQNGKAVKKPDALKQLTDRIYAARFKVTVAPHPADIAGAVLEPGNYQFKYEPVFKPDGGINIYMDVKPRDPSLPALTPKGTIILLHGIFMNKDSVLHWGVYLAEHGYRTVLLDLRGHGESTGKEITYGAWEKADLSQVLDELARRNLVTGQIGVLGISYGGAIAIQWAANDPRIVGLVALAPFSDTREAITGAARQLMPDLMKTVGPSLFGSAIEQAASTHGFNWNDTDVLGAAAQLRHPLLLIHGANDDLIPITHSERLRAVAPAGSQLLRGNGNHFTLAARLEPIAGRVTAWFDHALLASTAADNLPAP